MSRSSYLELRAHAEVIEQDGHGEKVLLRPDGTYLKLFRRKRLISSALWYPYAERFADNATMLLERGFFAPRVIALYRIPEIRRDLVHYHPVPGRTLRQMFRTNPRPPELPQLQHHLAAFVDSLFVAGIYFRSLHLGNIVQMPDGHFGLIDISDLRHRNKPLGRLLRQRNLERIRRICEPGEEAWFRYLPSANQQDQPETSAP